MQRAEGGGPLLRPGSNGGDIGGDYAFAKYNKRVDLLRYNDEEYEQLCSGDPSWSRAETDFLLELCLRFDLRFAVIADRYDWPGGAERTVEDLKARYYGIAQRLVEARADFPEQAAVHPVCAEPFNAAHERERKEDLAALLSRSAAREREESELLAKAAEIESARKVEMEAARAAGKAVRPWKGQIDVTAIFSHFRAASCRSAPAPQLIFSLSPSLASAPPQFGFGSRAGGRFPDLRPDHAPLVDIEQDPGGPLLATPNYTAERPPPGVFARGAHTIAVASEVAVRVASARPPARHTRIPRGWLSAVGAPQRAFRRHLAPPPSPERPCPLLLRDSPPLPLRAVCGPHRP